MVRMIGRRCLVKVWLLLWIECIVSSDIKDERKEVVVVLMLNVATCIMGNFVRRIFYSVEKYWGMLGLLGIVKLIARLIFC